jgi:hypothetical protein
MRSTAMPNFPKPWVFERTGPSDWIVRDATGRKLFYVIGDEGDGDQVGPSVLVWGNEKEEIALLREIEKLLTKARIP